jgi:isocitrate/isopropylmalate dehydrogenase
LQPFVTPARCCLRYPLNQQEASKAIERAEQLALEDGWRTADIRSGQTAIVTQQMG